MHSISCFACYNMGTQPCGQVLSYLPMEYLPKQSPLIKKPNYRKAITFIISLLVDVRMVQYLLSNWHYQDSFNLCLSVFWLIWSFSTIFPVLLVYAIIAPILPKLFLNLYNNIIVPCCILYY
jgi:hypothetical protein